MEHNIIRPIKQASALLSQLKLSSPASRKEHHLVIHKIIKELYRLERPFNSLSEVSYDDLQALVDHWKNRPLKQSTIANRVTILRKFHKIVDPNSNLPDQKSLGIQVVKKTPVFHCETEGERALNSVFHPFVKLIIKLQMEFGLRKSEAVNIESFILSGCYDQEICIPRAISSANQDRFIPVTSTAQKELINDCLIMMDLRPSFQNKLSTKQITSLYNLELAFINTPISFPFRAIYAIKRLHQLTKELAQQKEASMHQIRQEMGIKTVATIERWCHE